MENFVFQIGAKILPTNFFERNLEQAKAKRCASYIEEPWHK